MLVRIRPEAHLSAAEREFVDCLRAVPTTCLTLVDVLVDRGGRRIDAVLLTPRGMTVAEIRGFRRRQSGILSVRPDRPWKISGAPLELDEESSPADELVHGIYAVRATLERSLLDPGHMGGFVALLPHRGVVVRPARTSLGPGLDVVVVNATDTGGIRSYIEKFGERSATWDVDRVIGAVDALEMGEGLSRADLRDEGFVDRNPGGPEPRPRTTAAPLLGRESFAVPAAPSPTGDEVTEVVPVAAGRAVSGASGRAASESAAAGNTSATSGNTSAMEGDSSTPQVEPDRAADGSAASERSAGAQRDRAEAVPSAASAGSRGESVPEPDPSSERTPPPYVPPSTSFAPPPGGESAPYTPPPPPPGAAPEPVYPPPPGLGLDDPAAPGAGSGPVYPPPGDVSAPAAHPVPEPDPEFTPAAPPPEQRAEASPPASDPAEEAMSEYAAAQSDSSRLDPPEPTSNPTPLRPLPPEEMSTPVFAADAGAATASAPPGAPAEPAYAQGAGPAPATAPPGDAPAPTAPPRHDPSGEPPVPPPDPAMRLSAPPPYDPPPGDSPPPADPATPAAGVEGAGYGPRQPDSERLDPPAPTPRPSRLNPLPRESMSSPVRPPVPAAPPATSAPRRPSRLRNPLAWLVLAVASFGLLVVVVMIVTAGGGSDDGGGGSEPVPSSTVVPGTVTIEPTTTPPGPNSCFPFQTDC